MARQVFTISTSDIVNDALFAKIVEKRIDRIPVAWAGNQNLIIGVVRAETLLAA